MVSILSCDLFRTRQSSDPVSPQTKVPCAKDSDCILVNKDCCGCRAGGDSIAIHKSQESDYNNKWKEACSIQSPLCKQWYRCELFQIQCRDFQCVATQAH
ncbi:MAG: hypothetical protein OXB86_02250 [Bdellovibrionales bacterium]|nr:hypothetical protein [Bdellovibrionales bacterium]